MSQLRRRLLCYLPVVMASYSCLLFGQSVPGLQCVANAGVPPTVRSEGLTELVADVVINCTGGTPTPAGATVPTANISAFLNIPLTNRPLFPGSPITDALLLIDEPQSANQVLAGYSPASNASSTPIPAATGTGALSGPNVFQGIVTGNTVTFLGVPIDPNDPNKKDKNGTPIGRIYRITNLRANANALAAGSGSPAAAVVATLAIGAFTGSGTVTLTNPQPTVAFAKKSFSGIVAPLTATQCQNFNSGLSASSVPDPNTPTYMLLSYKELFTGAFRPRVASQTQNVPGTIYNTETGFQVPISASQTAGLADFGTRLKAIFNNVPNGVKLFVENTDTSSAGGLARLVVPTILSGSNGMSEVPVVNGSAAAVWEVINTNPGAVNNFNFGAWVSYSGSPNAPAPGTMTVNQSYAPTTPNTVGGTGSGTTDIPRFADWGSARNVFTITQCQTLLLFPFVTNSDSRTCFPGTQVTDPSLNSCTTGDSPSISIGYSGGVVTPTFVTTPDGGVSLGTQFLTGTTPLNGFIAVNSGGASPGTYKPSLTINAPGATSTTVQVPVTVLPDASPYFNGFGFVDAGNYQSNSATAGQIYSIFGKNFGPGTGILSASLDVAGRIPNLLGGYQVWFDGKPSSLLFVGNGQLAGVVPAAVAGKTSTTVQLISGSLQSPPVTLAVKNANISVLSANASGGGQGAITNVDGTLNSAKNPAARGSIVVIYASYSGPMTPPITDGRTTTGPPYPVPAGPLSVSFGGVPATDIKYFGNVPTLLESVVQINVTVPTTVKPDSNIPVTVSAGGATSLPWTTIAVK